MKKVILWTGGIILAIVVIASLAGGDEDATDDQVAADDQATEATEPERGTDDEENEKEPVDEPENTVSGKITKEDFDKIKDGMTYEEVVKIIGSEGEVMSESGSEGDPSHTIMYSWEGEGDIGANANMTFQGGELVNKAQFGLK